MAILVKKVLEAEHLASKKWVNLLPEERARLVDLGAQFARGIDESLQDLNGSLERITGTYHDFGLDESTQQTVQVLDAMTQRFLPDKGSYYAVSLQDTLTDDHERLTPRRSRERKRPSISR